MDEGDRQPLPPCVVHSLHCAGAKVPVVVIHRQQAAGMVHHVLVSQPVVGHGGIFRSSGNDHLCTVLAQNRQSAAAFGIPVPIVSVKGKDKDQLDIAVLRLFFQLQQQLARPEVYPESSPVIETADAFIIKLNKLLLQPALEPLAAVVVFVVFPLEPGGPVASNGAGYIFHIAPPCPIGWDKYITEYGVLLLL